MKLVTRDWQRRPYWVVAIGLLVLFVRRPYAFLRPEFWAEDFVFLLDAEKFGLASFVMPQAGYLHLIPRTIAWMGSYLDPFLQPGFFLIGWLIVAFSVVFSCLSRRHDLPLKPLLAAVVLIVPHTGEVFFNPTNAQWLAALGLLLTILKKDPLSTFDWVTDLIFVFFAGLSGPFIILALPLFFLRAWQRRTSRSFIFLGFALLLAGVQGWFVAHAGPDHEFSGPFSLFNLFATVSYRLPTNLFFGAWITGSSSQILIMAIAAGLTVFFGFAIYNGRRFRDENLKFFFFIVLLLAATTARKRFDLWGWGDVENGDRYFFIPKVLLLWVTIVAFAAQTRRGMRLALLLLLVCSTLSNIPRLRFRQLPDTRWYALCPEIRAGHEVEVTINPGWKFKYRRDSN